MTAPIIENNYTGDGSTVLFSFTFEYIEATDIEVSIDNVTIATTEYSLANSTTIEFNTAPATGTAVRIYRNTTVNEPKATFFPGSAIRAQDLNDNFEQILFVTQEADAISERAETAADAAQTATTTAQAAAASANTAGAAAQASATAAQASATAAQTSATAAAADASQASTDAASAVATANTASTNASNAVTTANTASALISTAVLADGTRAMSGDLNVNSNKVVNLANPTAGGDAVNKSFADANYQPLDAELTELATMQNTTASALADLTQAEVLVLDGATLSTAELNTLDGITATTSELNALDGITSTVGELNVLDGVTATTTELNITDGLTASTAELNQLDGKTISNVLTPANNNDIPTSSAVNTYVSGLLNALGGFVAIANESSFPTTNPDPSDNAGTVVSITDAGGLVVDSSGNSTSATTTGNATVTITGFPSSLHSTTLGNDLGLQVQTTSTLNTYTYHKLIAKESDVVRLSDDINDFNERYRVSASAPTTDLDAGDLWFDTTAGKMKVYDANDSAWEEVQSVGNFFINTLSSSSGTGGGSATFNGSAYRFTLSNAGTTAQQMLVSINGVVQKPNSGTSQPSEGFAIDTNDIIFAAAPASSASYFIVTIGSSVNIGQPSNNTVDTSELVDGAVTNAKVSSSAAIAGTKISPDFGTQTVETDGNVYAAKIGVNTSSPRNISGFGSLAVDGTSGSLVDLFRNGTREGTAAVDSGGFKLEAVGSSTPLIGITNGAERMRIDSSGDVQARRARSNTAGDVALSVQPSDSSIHYGLRIDAANNSLNLDRASGTAANLLTVDSSGNVGIGTTPTKKLHIDSSSDQIRLSDGSGGFELRAGNVLKISDDGTERLRIDSSGRLLVGTSTEGFADAADNFTIADSGNCGMTIRSGSSNAGSIYFSDATSGSGEYDGYIDYQHSSQALRFGTNAGSERMRIASNGNVGIGTDSPGQHLTIKRTGGQTQVSLISDTNESGAIYFGDTASTNRGVVLYDHGQDSLQLYTAGSERMRINSSGDILLACTSGSASSDSGVKVSQTNSNPWLRIVGNESVGSNFFLSGYNTNSTNNGYRFYVKFDGGIANHSSNNVNLSDEREKKNIVNLDTKWDKVKSWELKKFHYNEDADTDDLRYGVIAQQVEEHCPEVLSSWVKQSAEDAVLDDDGNVVTPAVPEVVRKGVKEQQMMWMAIKALQEAQARIETLKAKVAALEAAE